MNVQADPNKIEELSQQFKRWRRELESSYVQMVNVANRTAGSARSSYSEDSGVRSAANQVERLAQEIQREARELVGRLEEQSRLLYQAAGEYRQLEREAERKLQSSESSRLPTELKRFISQGVHAGSGALAPMSVQMLPAMKQLYRIIDQTSFIRKLMDMMLSKQVSAVQADPMVAEWLRALTDGTPEEKEAARLKLSTIAMSLTAIKEAQREYSVYHYFGRSGYMDEAHVRANEAREKLRALGVDDTYYNEQVKLAGTNLLDSLEACRYNPLKEDGSPMPEQAELLEYIEEVIAKGQVDPLDALQYQLLEEKLRKIESGELPPTHLPDGTLIDENNKWNETTFAYFETYIKHEGMEASLTHYDSWVKETYGRTKWEGFVKTSGEVTMGFTKGLLTGIIEGIVDTAGLAYQLVVDPQQVGQDMLYAAEYLIQNPDMVVEAAKQMYANFESASPEEKAEMIGKVSSILVPGMGVTKAGKAAKVPEALSSMTQAVKTSKIMNVLANPVKKFKEIDWKSYTIRFQDWVQSLKPGRFAVTPDGMLVRIPDETSSVVRRIDAGDGKKIEGTGELGSHAPGTQVRDGRKSLDTPDEQDIPKVVNGDSGHSSNITLLKSDRAMENPPLRDHEVDIEGTSDAVPIRMNNFEFVNGFDDHMTNAQGIVRKGNKGVVGGHNLENFERILTDQGWKLDEIIISRTAHSTVPGVYQIQYRLPALDRELNVIPGQYKNIPHPKTVYDPNVISNDQMIKWGKEAMEHGEIVGREIRGTTSNGLKFTGYLDENGKVTNFFPTISE